MIQEFCFTWNGRSWNGYFNALSHETVIAHFEDELIRQTIGHSLSYQKSENGAIACRLFTDVQVLHNSLYDAVLKGVEVQLGKPLNLYLN